MFVKIGDFIKFKGFLVDFLSDGEEKSVHDHTKRESFRELFWPQTRTFWAGGGYKNPIQTRKTISTTEIFHQWAPIFFGKEKFLHWSRAVYAFFFPSSVEIVAARDLGAQILVFPRADVSSMRATDTYHDPPPIQGGAETFGGEGGRGIPAVLVGVKGQGILVATGGKGRGILGGPVGGSSARGNTTTLRVCLRHPSDLSSSQF